jgi:hypothetical protein
VPTQPVAGHNGPPLTSYQQPSHPVIPSTAVPKSHHRIQYNLYPQSLRGAISSIISPHPSPSVNHSNRLQMNHPRKVRPTGWTVSSWKSTTMGGWPIHALCFFLGFFMPPLWWVASFLKVPKTRTIEGGDAEKSEAPDDLQAEFGTCATLVPRLCQAHCVATRCHIVANAVPRHGLCVIVDLCSIHRSCHRFQA